MKKIGLFVLSFIAIFFVGVSFADIVEPNTHYVDKCVKFQNVEIDNYRVVVENYGPMTDEIYELQANQCLEGYYKFADSRQYLLDKSIDIEELTHENIQDKAIQIGNLRAVGGYVDDSNPLTSETFVYKIVKNGSNYTLETIDEDQKFNDEGIENENNYKLELVETEQGIDVTSPYRLVKFLIARLITILIETIVLFAIAKLFRKNDQISNWRLILIGILASTITLPLLRFVLPLFITDKVGYTIIGELSVTLIEIFIIKYGLKVSRTKAIIASIVCNLCSYLLGLLIF